MKTFDVQKRNLNVFQNHILEASAGTGKTFSIENLVVRLLIERPKNTEEPFSLSQILVVTFTRAATRELKERIRANIEKALTWLCNDEPTAPDYILAIREMDGKAAKKRLQAALANYDEAQIFTLHGFCARMLRECQEAVASHGVEEKGLSDQLLNQIILDFFRTEVRLPYCSSAQLALAGDLEKLQRNLRRHITKTTPIAAVPTYEEFFQSFNSVMGKLKQQYGWTSQELIDHYDNAAPLYKVPPGKKTASLARQQAYYFASLIDKTSWTSSEFDEVLRHGLVFCDVLGPEQKKKKSPDSQIATILSQELAPIVEQARDKDTVFAWMAKGCQNLLQRYVEEEGISGSDQLLLQMSQAVLDMGFCSRVSSRYRFAIVDEFQDTDAQQWQILQKLFLNQQGTHIALVGDPKQAIYGFRQADIYTYINAVQSFAQEHHASLVTNYRSCKPLVEAVNHLFCEKYNPKLLSIPAVDSSLAYLEVLSAPNANSETIPDGRGALHFFIAKAKKGLSKRWPTNELEQSVLYPYIANEIFRLVRFERHYRDIAILTRGNVEASRLLEFFTNAGVPAILERSGRVTDSPAFAMLTELLHAAMHPWDNSATMQLLGGALLRFTQQQATEWLLRPEKVALIHQLSEKLHLSGVSFFVEEFLQSPLTPSEVPVIEYVLSREGGAELYRDLRHLAELLAEDCSGSLIEGLMRLKDFDEDDERTKIRADGKQDAVRILTIHASKGLEYPIVFANGVAARPTNPNEVLVPSNGHLVLAKVNPKASEAYLYETDAEKVRLAYVAMTRAKERLYVPFLIPDKSELNHGQASPIEVLLAGLGRQWNSRHELHGLMENLSEEHLIAFLKETAPEERISCEVLSDFIALNRAVPKKIPPLLVAPPQVIVPGQELWIESFTSLASYRGEDERFSTGEPQILPAGREFGVFVHGLLEKLAFEVVINCASHSDLIPHIQPYLQATPYEGCLEAFADLIFNTLKTPLQIKDDLLPLCMIDPTKQFKEMEFLTKDSLNLLKGSIDFVFCHSHRYYIVDWKTNLLDSYSPESITSAIDSHQYDLQARIYSSALCRFVKTFDERPIEESFGGAFYLFLRGMNASIPQSGVYYFSGASLCME